MPQLHTIVYVSTANHLLSEIELEALLSESRALNFQNSITGVLLYNDGNFMQCFEGAPQAVAETYERIVNSHQHKDIIELMNEPIACRSFADWQMGFVHSTRSDILRLALDNWRQHLIGESAEVSSSLKGLSLLQNFCKGAGRA